MKPRIRVMQVGCKFDYDYELDAQPPEVDFVAEQFFSGIALENKPKRPKFGFLGFGYYFTGSKMK